MKRFLIYSGVVLSVALVGCKKYLETLPDNRIDLSDPANITVGKVSELLVNAYPKANYMGFCESMSDNVADKGGGSLDNANFGAYTFQDINSAAYDMPQFYWNECYTAIATANEALAAIGRVSNPEAYNAQKGEALVARAYAHFMLVNFFSKTYDAATASTDPGIPYVTEPETVVFKKYERKTVAYVYDQIEADLTTGMALIRDEAYTVPRYHFTKSSTHAFAERFYLFKKQYDKAVEQASKIFPGGDFASNMRPWQTEYRTITYDALQLRYTKATEKANLLLVETASAWARSYIYNRMGLTSAKADTVLGKNVTGGSYAYTLYGSTTVLNIPKFNEHFVQAGINANTGYPFNVIPLFTTEEALLNRAEAYAMLNNFNAAIADLNTYASMRVGDLNLTSNAVIYNPAKHGLTADKINTYYKTTDTRSAIVKAVLDFKRAEFVHEGMRWFDILRHNIPVIHSFKNGQKDSTITLTASDPRRLLQIPEAAALNGIAPNPR